MLLLSFKCTLSAASRVQCSSIMFKRRQTTLRLISPKLCNPHQNNLDGWIEWQVKGKMCNFDFGVNCPFKVWSGDSGKSVLKRLVSRLAAVSPRPTPAPASNEKVSSHICNMIHVVKMMIWFLWNVPNLTYLWFAETCHPGNRAKRRWTNN